MATVTQHRFLDELRVKVVSDQTSVLNKEEHIEEMLEVIRNRSEKIVDKTDKS